MKKSGKMSANVKLPVPGKAKFPKAKNFGPNAGPKSQSGLAGKKLIVNDKPLGKRGGKLNQKIGQKKGPLKALELAIKGKGGYK